MFFSPELLSRRDSGFSLLWLAATLGSKSSFKKLPKRSILTADITQLCDLIAEPAEPLALRLSSNLMVGVARVYKVKQEIFMSDVLTCFNSLKKMVQELQAMPADDTWLQMAQGSIKPSALTLAADPRTAFTIDFDNLVADWDEYLNIGENHKSAADDPDANFNPKTKKQAKQRHKSNSLPLSENVRADLYTLKEYHDHLLSNSFDVSFHGSGALDPFSSQFQDGFGFDDNIFDAGDGLDVGGIGDELAKELGEGWGSPMKTINENMGIDPLLDVGLDDIDPGVDFAFDVEGVMLPVNDGMGGVGTTPGILFNAVQMTSLLSNNQRHDSDKENLPPSSLQDSNVTPRSATTATGFSHLFLSQDDHPAIDNITAAVPEKIKKPKRTRLLLDARIELTDEELKTANMQYVEGQDALRREIFQKKSDRDSGKMVEDMLWGVPRGIQAQELVDFWQENFRIQVEARSGTLHLDNWPGQPPAKRRKVRASRPQGETNDDLIEPHDDFGNEIDVNMDMDIGMGDDNMLLDPDGGRLRSSEEPGQGRRVSRPPSVGFDLEMRESLNVSQRSSLFPWDNAGATSSQGGMVGVSGQYSDRVSLDRMDIINKSLSRKGSSSRMGSVLSGVGLSPGHDSRFVEDFAFDVPDDNLNPPVLDTQQSDINLITLERNSFNFLEYAKMQYQTLPDLASLMFDNIVPPNTSTRHVAAAAFYHCLVLATKDLIRLHQKEPYSVLAIRIA